MVDRVRIVIVDDHPLYRRGIRTALESQPDLRVAAEVGGKLAVDAPGGPFILTARADRIDDGPSGAVITDYKTGAIPSSASVIEGTAPQLPLEAAIALAGGFAGTEPGRVGALRYISATGGDPPGKLEVVKCPDVAALAAETLAGLARLVARFDDETTPYAAVRRAGFRYDYDDYAHLARVAEWSAASAEEA